MPIFSTNPQWYNSAGVLDRSLTGVANKNSGYDNIAIGYNSAAGSSTETAGTNSAIAIGYDAQARSNDSIAIGSRSSEDYGTYAYADRAISIGAGSQVRGSGAIGIGYGVSIEGSSSIAIGNKAQASSQYSIAIGNNAVADGSDTIQLGDNNGAYTLNVGNIKDSTIAVGNVSCSKLTAENANILNGTFNGNTIFNSNATFNGSLTIPNKGFDAIDPLGTEKLSLSDEDRKEKIFNFPFSGDHLNTLKSGHGVVAFEIIGRKGSTTTVYGPYLIQFPSSTSTHILKYYSASGGNYEPELIVVLKSSIGSNAGNIEITLKSNATINNLYHYMDTVQFQMIRIANLSFTQPA